MEHRRGHIVPLAAVSGELLDRGEDVVQQLDGGLAGMPAADIPEPLQLKFLPVHIPGIGQSVGTEQYGIARREVQRGFVVNDPAEEAWRDPRKLQDPAFFAPYEQRARHAGAHDAQLRAKRVKNGVLNRAVASRDAPEEQPFVQDGEDPARGLARIVHTPQRPDRQRGIQRRRQALPGYVPEIQADHAVRKLEIVQEIASYFRGRLELMRNRHAIGA